MWKIEHCAMKFEWLSCLLFVDWIHFFGHFCLVFIVILNNLHFYFRMIRLLEPKKHDICLNIPVRARALGHGCLGCLVFPLADSRHRLLPLRFSRSGKTSGRSKRLIQVLRIVNFSHVIFTYVDTAMLTINQSFALLWSKMRSVWQG